VFKLNHIALTVADRERSAAFYGRFFGLTNRVHEDTHLLILAAEDGSLLALSEGEAAAASWPRTTHFGFQAASAQAVQDLRKTFKEHAVQEAEWQESGPVRVQVFDRMATASRHMHGIDRSVSGDVQTYQLVLIRRPKLEVTTRDTITYTAAADPEKKQISGDIVTKVTITETVSHPPRCYRPK
jgi:catechol 2,3-dioxygenase-like lactoylglutathione lyase family enzyme